MARLAVFESKNCSINFGGFDLDDGRAETFVKISPKGPAYESVGPGADGHIARCGTNNNLYDVELTFMGTSSEHARLSAIHIADRSADNGAGVAPLMIKDNGGSMLYATDRAWITAMPEVAVGVKKDDVTWKFEAIFEPGMAIAGGN